MNLVTGAFGSLLPKIEELLGEEYKLQTSTQKQVESLSRELESIQAFLVKVGDVPWDQLDEQVKVWAREVREASYDMEDILDAFLVRVQGREEPADPSMLRRAMEKMASLFRMGKRRRDACCAIKDIMKRLQEVADRRARYKIDDMLVSPAARTPAVDPRLQAMYKEVERLVGMEKPRDDLISMLSSQADDMGSRKKKIVAIVGAGGLGKTTLAKAVYDKLRVDFDCGAFVPVGRKPNPTKVLMDILYDLDKNKYESIPETQRDARRLIDGLREFLKNKRYFIVIDDTWDNKSWEEIELALLENNCGSRIIVTTRNLEVATKVGNEVYKMQPLSDDNSKRLFYTRIFGAEGKCHDNQPDEIPNKILKKCDGIPLAIITTASLLVGKPREKWCDVFTSIGFGHKDNQQVETSMKILSYSYYDMPSYLRTCLLYLSVFPEDYTIQKDSLIWKWIAEGFVREKQGISLFELGERYFNDLVNRSMIQAIGSEWDGTVHGCRVHDMVLDLLRSMSCEENFATVLDNYEGTVAPPSSARRLAHHNKTVEHTPRANMVRMPQVRSFIACRCAFDEWVPLPSFKLLRVLAMENCNGLSRSHLVQVGNLLHLRYLGLEHTIIDELPNEIGALKFLQILNLKGSGQLELTPNISRLTELVCLRGGLFSTWAPFWIFEELMSLEELEIGASSWDFLKVLGSLTELRVLRIWFSEIDESKLRDLVLSLGNLQKLQHLDISCGRNIDVDAVIWEEAGFVLSRHLRRLDVCSFTFSCLPSCISAACLPSLSHLSLRVDTMGVEHLECLGRLPELCFLRVYTRSTVTISNITAGSGYFQKLRVCVMHLSMIQFQCKEEDSSVSFHLWNGKDAMPFGFSKNDRSVPPSSVMPNLGVLKTMVFVRALKDGNGDCGNIGLEYLTSLRKAIVNIDCEGASSVEVDQAEAALRNATEAHPSRPTLHLSRRNEYNMISAVQDQEAEDDDVPTEKDKEEEVTLIADDDVAIDKLSLAPP